MKQAIGSAALALFLAAAGAAYARTPKQAPIVKKEPLAGMMLPGASVYVDDGSCGKGKIKEVIGGEVSAMNPRPRTVKCVPKS